MFTVEQNGTNTALTGKSLKPPRPLPSLRLCGLYVGFGMGAVSHFIWIEQNIPLPRGYNQPWRSGTLYLSPCAVPVPGLWEGVAEGGIGVEIAHSSPELPRVPFWDGLRILCGLFEMWLI